MGSMAQQQLPDDRPALHMSRSFTRMPTTPTSPRQKRASTLQTPSGIPAVPSARIPSPPSHRSDIFEIPPSDDEEPHPQVSSSSSSAGRPHDLSPASAASPDLRLPITYADLPIEIKSLTERFLDSLSAKVHDKPPPADALSEIFQSFYDRAASHINVHIASLASRIGRQPSPATNAGGRKRANSSTKPPTDSNPSAASGGEMLTATEITHRRRARRVLELQRLALEETVERVVCERVYTSLYQHPSTDDEARDEKLCSRIAALRVVGIGLKDLQQTPLPATTTSPGEKVAGEKNEDIDAALGPAREALDRMSGEHFPAGKLACLKSAHQRIVDVLAQHYPSSASADEVLPTLIYTLMTCPPAGVEAVSNLGFVQRFRGRGRVEGEAAYCLVNLEAAVAFLETVDLPSLRAEEGPGRGASRPGTPGESGKGGPVLLAAKAETLKPGLSPVSANTTETEINGDSTSNDAVAAAKTLPTSRGMVIGTSATRPKFEQRRLSSLVQAQADRLEAGRDEFLRTADKIYDSINGTLDSSLQFVFGRFGGKEARPKTLEEARRLVSSSTPEMESGRSSPGGDPLGELLGVAPTPTTSGRAAALEQLVGPKGVGVARERSVDSAVSGGSGKRVAFSEIAGKGLKAEGMGGSGSGSGGVVTTPGGGAGGNIFTSINPLNKFTIMPGFARFGRVNSAASNPPLVQPSPPTDKTVKAGTGELSIPPPTENFPNLEKVPSVEYSDGGDEDMLNAREALAALRRIAPPRRRFLEVRGAGELRIGEVEELLREYRRLAKAIGEAVVE